MKGTATQRHIRWTAAAASGLVAILYLLTGSGAVAVTYDQPAGAIPPLLIAAGLFAVLAVLLLRVAQRWVWLAGAGLQAVVIAGYVAIAADRIPAFEAWGITIKVLQVVLLGAFAWLALRGPTQREAGRGNQGRLSAA